MKKILLFYLFIGLTCCEPDDICSESTSTTPRLVIEFFDIENLNDTKTVPGLFAVALDEQGLEIPIIGELVNSRYRIELPLNGNFDQSKFKLYKNYDINDGIVQGNPDIITVNYTTEAIYVSRACGYKNNYYLNEFNIDNDIDLWMVLSEISNNEVQNENTKHVQIFH